MEESVNVTSLPTSMGSSGCKHNRVLLGGIVLEDPHYDLMGVDLGVARLRSTVKFVHT